MAEIQNDEKQPVAARDKQEQAVVDRLVFAALREQTRARRWRIGFMLFFIIYLTVVTIVAFNKSSGGFIVGGEADGEKHTAVVKVSGVIASGEEGGSEIVIAGLESAFEHEDTAVIVLEINSPGGSPVQAAYIYDEILRLRQKHESIPVHAVVVDIAASGGYFVAAAADKIHVNQSSLVGSIGVRMDAFGFVDLMKKIGVERRLLTAGENKGLFDPFLPEQADQKAHLQSMLNEVHAHFIDAVKKGRGDRLVEAEEIFSGLIWSGETALSLGLADAYGTTRSVARELEAEDIVDFTPTTGLLDRIADRIGSSAGRSISGQILGTPGLN
ncbi:MAG: S49 family peptidase [Gammaproteobacteria bacterium]|nr:S49 family peptidase [Gammaproteobacteria bacterium]